MNNREGLKLLKRNRTCHRIPHKEGPGGGSPVFDGTHFDVTSRTAVYTEGKNNLTIEEEKDNPDMNQVPEQALIGWKAIAEMFRVLIGQ